MFKNDKLFVEQCTKVMNPIINYLSCLTPKYVTVANKSNGVIGEDVIGMINAGDYEAAAEKYGINIKTGENIIQGIQKDMKQRIDKAKRKIVEEQKIIEECQIKYDALREENVNNLVPKIVDGVESMVVSDEHENKLKDARALVTNAKNRMKTQEDRVISLNDRLNTLTKVIQEVGEETCGICIDTMAIPTMVHCCKMLYCYECINDWMTTYGNKTCPYCRHPITSKDLDTIITVPAATGGEGAGGEESSDEIKSKDDTIGQLFKRGITTGEFKKVLIFTEHDASIDNIEKVLDKQGVKYISYRRSVSGFTNIVKYIEGDVQVVILNSVSHGAGLNLQKTSDVILYHKMSPGLELQAIGRAQRPGREEALRIWRLGHDGEYPEEDLSYWTKNAVATAVVTL
jgi:SNF2 family DNA or RNA helicase